MPEQCKGFLGLRLANHHGDFYFEGVLVYLLEVL